SKGAPTILVVEDHSDSRTLLSAWLRAKGYKVVEARNGKEGLLQANRVRPDLILMDLTMPELDGVEAARQIRARHVLSQTPRLHRSVRQTARPGDAARKDQRYARSLTGSTLSSVSQSHAENSNGAEAKQTQQRPSLFPSRVLRYNPPPMNCPSCHKEIAGDASSCPSCGYSFEDATQRLEPGETPSGKPRQKVSRSYTSLDSIDDARFVPGTMLAERYRIVGLLGRGGMGEVYRADDLKLGQPVALKFLPEHLLSDGAALARFHREVRVARQVSHRNVCRVYDIGEIDGRHFLSMEFIKGEELSSLLRRIGRLPGAKAIQIARQICAGLAAAHDVGVLHRDLKPSNVMIDEHGNARILDFGLAGLVEEFGHDEMRAGTPAYMSPEQIEGQEQTVKSDVYSLGLVLYELFTGQRAFEASSLNDMIKLRRSDTAPTTPTSIVKDLDPGVEKVIDRCIQKDPSLRPASALQVAAALPGGDPIAAALAAGETPSPEMVAAAPKQGILRPNIAGMLLISFLVMLALCCWLTKYTAVYRMTGLDQSPEVLRAHARDVIRKLGYTEQPLDTADGVILKQDYLSYIATHDQSPMRWEKMRT
ncbi:MAG: hypothetical protein DMF70_09885, partial [Acidobacteria bacterium]